LHLAATSGQGQNKNLAPFSGNTAPLFFGVVGLFFFVEKILKFI
jgi:hypothetical protein